MNKRLKVILSFIAVILVIGCKSQITKRDHSSLAESERKICESLKIDTAIIQEIRIYNTQKIEPFHYSLSKIIENGQETEAEPIFLKGLVFTEKNSKSYDLVFSLKDNFRKKGYSIFLLENNFDIDKKTDAIGILKTTDKYTVLRQVATDGTNYGITNDSLIKAIRIFDKKYSLELIGASGDLCEFIIHNEPKNWITFAKEVYKFCPDVVDQGTGTIEALAQEMKRTKRLYFWWD